MNKSDIKFKDKMLKKQIKEEFLFNKENINNSGGFNTFKDTNIFFSPLIKYESPSRLFNYLFIIKYYCV